MKISFSKNLLIIVISLVTISQCHSQKRYSFESDTALICYLTDVFTENGSIYINVRPIQLLWGLGAIIEAKKDSAAEYYLDTATKKHVWYVPNDYYIITRVTSEYKLRVTDTSEVSIYSDAVRNIITVQKLMSDPFLYKLPLYSKYTYESVEPYYHPFEIALEKNVVTVINEIYVP